MKNIVFIAILLAILVGFFQYANSNAQAGCFWLLFGMVICELQLMIDKDDRIK